MASDHHNTILTMTFVINDISNEKLDCNAVVPPKSDVSMTYCHVRTYNVSHNF